MDVRDRGQFLNLSGLFEGGTGVLAFVLGWLFGVDPVAHLNFAWPPVLWGLAATVPMVALFLVAHYRPVGSLKPIRDFLVQVLGPSLAACRWFDLVLLAAIAGLAEELLFRGFLQPWLQQHWGMAWGLVGASVAFGLVHSVTVTYAVLAGLIGLYLGWLLNVTGKPQLLIPMVVHAVYDYIAFLVIRREYLRSPDAEEDVGSAVDNSGVQS